MRIAARFACALVFAAACEQRGEIARLAPGVADAGGASCPGTGPRARASTDFLDSLGVVQRLSSARTSLAGDLRRVGIRHIRAEAVWMNGGDAAAYRALRDVGVGVIAQLNVATDVAALAAEVGPALEGLQIPTPGDAGSGLPSVTDTRANTMRFAALARALTPAPLVIGPTLGDRDDASAIGDLSAYVDRGTYFYGGRPVDGSTVTDRLATARRYFGDRPLFATQGDPLATGPSHVPVVSEIVQAKYLLRLYLEAFRVGITRTYYGWFYDVEGSEPGGLVRNDGTPKPSFLALETLVTLLRDGGAAAIPAGSSTAIVPMEDSPGELRTLLLALGVRRWVLVTWLPVVSSDAPVVRTARLRLPPGAAKALKVDLAGTQASAPLSLDGENTATVDVSDLPAAVTFEADCP